MPSTLPPSFIHAGSDSASIDPAAGNKPQFVVSASGHAAHPDEIVASCRALQAHVASLQADAEAELHALDERIRARDLAEKRRVAPGWLDSDARLLEPERKPDTTTPSPSYSQFQAPPGSGGGAVGVAQRFSGLSLGAPGGQGGHGPGGEIEMAVPDEGEQLDRAFGTMGIAER